LPKSPKLPKVAIEEQPITTDEHGLKDRMIGHCRKKNLPLMNTDATDQQRQKIVFALL
jgi:hypothetical protein